MFYRIYVRAFAMTRDVDNTYIILQYQYNNTISY